jgi:DNA-binding GntR family transcriptional regulator
MQTVTDHTKIFEPLRQQDRSGVPKYMRLTNALTQAITSGHWRAGDKLPTEGELAELTPFSLGTVQRALRNLVDQGVVIRHHGLGSFVAETDLRLEDPWHCRFLDDDGESFLPVYSKVVSREKVVSRGAWSRYFPGAGERLMLITRIINVDNEFNVFVRFFMDSSMLPGLSKAALKTLDGLNFKTVISRELSIPITRITHDVRAMKFDGQIAEAIGVRRGDPGIFMQAAAHMGDSTCIYYQEFSIPMTNRVLSIPDQPHRPAKATR